MLILVSYERWGVKGLAGNNNLPAVVAHVGPLAVALNQSGLAAAAVEDVGEG